MGMLIDDTLVLAHASKKNAQKARLLTLGVPSLNCTDADFRRATGDQNAYFRDHAEFFRHLSFTEVDSLDISDYEGANILGDLNDSSLSDRITHRYDLIYDSGTLEHIFEAPTALRTLSKLTAANGVIVHATPTNGFMDHGFWQVSPDLFRSFYPAEGISVLTSALFVLGDYPIASPADRNIYRTQGRAFIVANIPEAIAVFAARKTREVSTSATRLQDYYRHMHEGPADSTVPESFVSFGSPLKARICRTWLECLLLKTARKARRIARQGFSSK
jgi:hypothetical protein